jgi:hypothetical protein
MLDGAVGVMRRYPRPTLGMSAAVAVVMALVNLVMTLTLFRPFLSVDPDTPIPAAPRALEAMLGGAAAVACSRRLLALLRPRC